MRRAKTAPELRQALDALYNAPLREFVATRNALAQTLRSAGDTEGAARVKVLPKPSVSAWTVNQLHFEHPDAMARLLESGERMRVAQQKAMGGAGGDSLQEALASRRRAIADLCSRAESTLRDHGHGVSQSTMQRISTTLEALAAYGREQPKPSAGRLSHDVEPSGLDLLAALAPDKPPKRARDSEGETRELQRAREQLRVAETTLREKKRALDRAQRAANDTRARLQAAHNAFEAAQSQMRADEASLEHALEQMQTADELAQEARRTVEAWSG